jgi:hypothetical protein
MDNFDWQAMFGDLEIEDDTPSQPVYAIPQPRPANAPRSFPVNTPGPRPIQQMSEIERKLAMANTYRTLLEDSIFEDLQDPIVAEVEGEIRKFITGRLETLMGGDRSAPPAVGGQFTQTEVIALKALAKKIIGVGKTSRAQPRRTAPPAPEIYQEPPAPPPAEPKLKKRRSPKASKLGRVPPGLEKRETEPTPQPPPDPIPPQPAAIPGSGQVRTRYRKDEDGNVTVEQYRPGISKLPPQAGGYPQPNEMMMAMDASQKVAQVSESIGPLLTEAVKRATTTP